MFLYFLIFSFYLQNFFAGFDENVFIENQSIKNIYIGSTINNAYVYRVIFKQVPEYVQITFLDQTIKCSLDQLFLTKHG